MLGVAGGHQDVFAAMHARSEGCAIEPPIGDLCCILPALVCRTSPWCLQPAVLLCAHVHWCCGLLACATICTAVRGHV